MYTSIKPMRAAMAAVETACSQLCRSAGRRFIVPRAELTATRNAIPMLELSDGHKFPNNRKISRVGEAAPRRKLINGLGLVAGIISSRRCEKPSFPRGRFEGSGRLPGRPGSP